jgi:hypothetical protein
MPSPPEDLTQRIQQDCWARFIDTYGTACTFERRAAQYERRVRLLTFLGIVGPVLVGGVITSFGTSWSGVPYLLAARLVDSRSFSWSCRFGQWTSQRRGSTPHDECRCPLRRRQLA